jgi:predicted TIM-barrel fold metal-dependent hydrolase
MRDNHIHIGYFYETYYNPEEILQTVLDAGIEKCLYSSTSSCITEIKYQQIEKEIEDTAKHFDPEIMQPLLWYVPDYIRQGLTIGKPVENLPYKGIKLHPRANKWDLNDKQHLDCLHSLFGFANDNHLPVLIHTGEDDFENPNFFEPFFAEYKKANTILAHCRPMNKTLEMFKKYDHVKGDTAFVSHENIQSIIDNGYKDRLLTGTDFPITHYFASKYKNSNKSLEEQYQEDIRLLACNFVEKT